MASGVQLGSTVDTHSRVSIRSIRQSLIRRLPPGVQENLVVWGDEIDAHAWFFNGYTLMRQSVEVLISHVFPASRWTSDPLEIWTLFLWVRVTGIHALLRWQLPTKFIGELTVYTASVPVAGYPGVCNHEVPLVLCRSRFAPSCRSAVSSCTCRCVSGVSDHKVPRVTVIIHLFWFRLADDEQFHFEVVGGTGCPDCNLSTAFAVSPIAPPYFTQAGALCRNDRTARQSVVACSST